MRRGPSHSPESRRRWHHHAEIRLGVVVLALLIVAAGAAALRGDGGDAASDEPQPVALATATPETAASPAPDTPTATPTVTPSPVPSAPSASTPHASPIEPPSTPTPTPAATPTASATAEPPPAPAVEVRPAALGPGETLLVAVDGAGAAAATLDFRGGSYRLLPSGERFWGVFAIPLGVALGPETAVVTLLDGHGAPLASLEAAYEVVHVERPIDYITLTPDQASVLTPEASAQEAALRGEQFAQFDADARWTRAFGPPAEGPITSGFGVGRSFNGAPVSGFHGGTDYGGDEGTPVRSAGPGRVSWAGPMPIRGNTVIVDHGGGVKTGYHHLSRIDVELDEVVATGTVIGAIGETGLVTGPHLHWELTVWGVNVDPLAWLAEAFVP